MFLHPAPDSEATASLYQSDIYERGHVMNLTRVWAWGPEVSEGFSVLRNQLTSNSSLSPRELAVIVCATAASVGDSYCALAWGTVLASRADAETAAAVLQHAEDADLTPRDNALRTWARKVVGNPTTTTPQDVQALRDASFTEREIFEATAFIAFRIAFSTVNGALGAQPDWQVAEAAPPPVRSAVQYGRPSAVRA